MNRVRTLFLVVFLTVVSTLALADEALVIKTAEGKAYIYEVELAVTPEEQQRGLMFRNELAENAGMLFPFPDSSERSFWMKNTLIPLDIIFVKEDGVIHRIAADTVPLDLSPIRSQGPARAAFEINAGQAAEKGIKPGDRLYHSIFGNSLAE